jgi:hypothetical protein
LNGSWTGKSPRFLVHSRQSGRTLKSVLREEKKNQFVRDFIGFKTQMQLVLIEIRETNEGTNKGPIEFLFAN